MLENIKKIMLEQYRSKYNAELQQYRNELVKLESTKSTYNIEQLSKEIDELNNKILEMKRKGFINKLFNRKKIEQISKELDEKVFAISQINSIEHRINYLNKAITTIQDDILAYSTTLENKDLFQMGLSFESACKILKAYNLQLVLTDDDKKVLDFCKRRQETNNSQTEISKDIETMKSYVLIHKTRFYPQHGRIKTRKEAGVEESISLSLDKIGSLKYVRQRNTLHFSVNGEVGSHELGEWDDCKYAVIIPFTKMPISQLRCGAVMDTYIENGLNLPNEAIILCPQEEVKLVSMSNPGVNVIGYIGQNVNNYANTLINMMGYNVEMVGKWSWKNQQDADEYYRRLKELNLEVHTTPHTYSREGEFEDHLTAVEVFKNLIDKIITENIVLSSADLEVLTHNNNISLAACTYNTSNLKLKKELQIAIFQEIIPFLNERGITIQKETIDKILYFISIDVESPTAEVKQTEVYNEYKNLQYDQHKIKNPSGYINYLLMNEIFEQMKINLENTSAEGKSR